MSVVVNVSEDAYTWIVNRGKHLIVSIYQGNAGCCTGGVSEIQFYYELPNEPKRYRQIQYGELTVYLAPQIPLKDNKLSIDIKGIGMFKRLTASGIQRF